jgi:diaminopimelate decarboxylase
LNDAFSLSYAVKANPNVALLRRLLPEISYTDVSSYTELERAIAAGCDPAKITFSGPAKRIPELRGAIGRKIGGLVVESLREAEAANHIAQQAAHRQQILLRINPAERQKKFGVSFSGRASQFGFDEEDLLPAIDAISRLEHLDPIGYHIYSATNSVDPLAIVNNFRNFVKVFSRAASHSGRPVRKLIFGAGFGLPYTAQDEALDIEAVAAGILPLIEEMRADPLLRSCECLLELGRWIVGPAGWLLTRVVGEKHSRGVAFRMMDAGFNNALAACGMMGTVLRRNWRLHNISDPEGEAAPYTLVGPLCTSIDVLASNILLPHLQIGDVVAVENSGAYGLTASPTRFISHPEPREILLLGDAFIDATESRANMWPDERIRAGDAAADIARPR